MSDKDWSGRPALSLLAEKEEDRFTVLLCELLRSRQVLQTFLDLCRLTPTDSLSSLGITNQVTVPNGRPDLVIHGPRTYLLFEAKVGSWLHDGQAKAYVDSLIAWKQKAPNGLARFTLIAPERACHGLQAEANSYALKVGAPRVECISWEVIAVQFESLAAAGVSPALQAHLKMFSDLVGARLGDAPRAFTGEEVGLLSDFLTARAYKGVWSAWARLVERIKRDKGLKLTSTASSSAQWQGQTLRTKSRWWWLGLWPEVWAQIGISPLVLQVPGLDGQSVRSLGGNVPDTVVYRDGNRPQMILPLTLVPAESPGAMLDRHFEIVRTVVVRRPETGGVGRPPK